MRDGLVKALGQTNLDFKNIGYNADSFNALSPEIKELAQSAARDGDLSEVQGKGEQGRLALIHMSKIAHAQQHLISTLLGPAGVALADFSEALSGRIPGAEGQLVSLAIRTASDDCISGDVYPVTRREYMVHPPMASLVSPSPASAWTLPRARPIYGPRSSLARSTASTWAPLVQRLAR